LTLLYGQKNLIFSSGSGGGKRLGLTPRENQALHSEWLSRFCIKLLWVISTDRFGDFVADEMIAPGKFIGLSDFCHRPFK